LEKTSKITKSNHPSNTTMPTKPCPELPHLHIFLNTYRDGDSTSSLGSLFQCLTTLSVKKIFLYHLPASPQNLAGRKHNDFLSPKKEPSHLSEFRWPQQRNGPC